METFHVDNKIYYFDSSGLLKKYTLFIGKDSINQEEHFYYNSIGDCVLQELYIGKHGKSVKIFHFFTYEQSRLLSDSASMAETCTHFQYDIKGGLVKQIFRGKNHAINRTLSFEKDSLGRNTRVIDCQYVNDKDTGSVIISDRSIEYDKKSRMIRENEKITSNPCFNQGSTLYKYDRSNRIIEIVRTRGLSQKIKYYDRGLISAIITRGQYCDRFFQLDWQYRYTYRK